MAELALAEQKKGEKPVLLLDDVMSELDSGRQECLLSLLKRDIQTFITDTKQRSDLSGHLFIVKGGKVLKA
ncbi:DNA replication and repair protein RecF [bioreactor metagenome]|uniref:DNA replication and repair protein RecF n=1 Tax=bioreactor metagenome TaxID=1076179 RepID=A0A645HE19_9ZZZZ